MSHDIKQALAMVTGGLIGYGLAKYLVNVTPWEISGGIIGIAIGQFAYWLSTRQKRIATDDDQNV